MTNVLSPTSISSAYPSSMTSTWDCLRSTTLSPSSIYYICLLAPFFASPFTAILLNSKSMSLTISRSAPMNSLLGLMMYFWSFQNWMYSFCDRIFDGSPSSKSANFSLIRFTVLDEPLKRPDWFRPDLRHNGMDRPKRVYIDVFNSFSQWSPEFFIYFDIYLHSRIIWYSISRLP